MINRLREFLGWLKYYEKFGWLELELELAALDILKNERDIRDQRLACNLLLKLKRRKRG